MSIVAEEKAAINRRTPNIELSWLPSIQALLALFVLSLRQQFRGWRPIVLCLLFLLPGALALVTYTTTWHRGADLIDGLQKSYIYTLIPHALAPLAALLCAGGIIRDDIEEQTLTYLLLRPIPRMLLYAVKLLAALAAVAAITIFFSLATLAFVNWIAGSAGGPFAGIPAARVAAVFGLAQVAYCGLFGIMGLLMRRSLIVGVAYIVLFEYALASYESLVRQATVMYHFRVLVVRWLKPGFRADWGINLTLAPTAKECVLFLLIAGAVLAGIGALIFSVREFRMKTPEGE